MQNIKHCIIFHIKFSGKGNKNIAIIGGVLPNLYCRNYAMKSLADAVFRKFRRMALLLAGVDVGSRHNGCSLVA